MIWSETALGVILYIGCIDSTETRVVHLTGIVLVVGEVTGDVACTLIDAHEQISRVTGDTRDLIAVAISTDFVIGGVSQTCTTVHLEDVSLGGHVELH